MNVNLNIYPFSYIGSEFAKVLDKPEVEYRQVNLTVPGTPLALYTPNPLYSAFR